jgi:D-apionolactonase
MTMASARAKRAIKLFGTEIEDPKPKELRAGPLSAMLDNGALRYIKLDGIEVLRAIAFLVRDENWGTYMPRIRNQKIRQTPKGFSVVYDAHCGDVGRGLEYRAEISASADGDLSFKATATPEADFRTNRTGFIVLHPLKGVAGAPVEIEHADGSRKKSKFPALIDPVQPFVNVRALRHKVMPGVFASCRMEGDAYETEDHRNWTDASFKTYIRPLQKPWPYTLPKGQTFDQSVTLALSGKLPRARAARAAQPVTVSLGRIAGAVPRMAVAVAAAEAESALAEAAILNQAKPGALLCAIDGRSSHAAKLVETYRRLSQETGAPVTLEIVIPGKADPLSELEPIAKAVKDQVLAPQAVIVSPASDLKAILPGSARGEDAPLEKIYRAARTAFPNAKIGGGMFSFFTELNRKRPPAELLDFVSHTTCPIVHAADDISVMETIEALSYVVQSTRAIIGKSKPYHVGPSTIPARLNPYGAGLAGNPDNGRVCLAGSDPRHRGIYGAAWTLGYVAALAYSGVDQVSLGAATGSTGIIHHPSSQRHPYYESLKASAVYPLFHVIAGLAESAGSKLISVSAEGEGIAALAHRSPGGSTLWLANLTSEKRKLKLKGFKGPARIHILDETTFGKATTDPGFLKKGGKAMRGISSLELGPYAVARLSADG